MNQTCEAICQEMECEAIWQEVEGEYHFRNRIVTLERELRPSIPPALWPKVIELGDLAVEQQVVLLRRAVKSRPELVVTYTTRA